MTKQKINESRMVACDLETTGLDARGGMLLEVALIVLDNDLNELGSHTYFVPAAPEDVAAAVQDPIVRAMHENSGLRAEHEHDSRMLRLAGFELEMVSTLREQEAAKFIRQHGAIDAPLLGHNVGFDREWLAAHQPILAGHFHYRIIDVSSVKELARRWAPHVLEGAPVKRGVHRGLADIRESIAELKHYRAAGLLDPPVLIVRQGSPDASGEGF